MKVSQDQANGKRFTVYSLLSWGSAIIIGGIGLTVDLLESDILIGPAMLQQCFVYKGIFTFIFYHLCIEILADWHL